MLILFLVLGAVSATDLSNVSCTEDSNLEDDENSLSAQNKLEISSEDSISETNLVNSHDDNLIDYPVDDVLSIDDSNYEDNDGIMQASNESEAGKNSEVLAAISGDEAVSASDSNSDVMTISVDESDILSATSNTTLSVSNTHYSKSATYFKVTLKTGDGKAIANQKVSLKVKGKTYSGSTNKNGVVSVKTASLAIGTYTVTVTYSGSSKYSASSLSKKVKVLSSVKGSDMTKYDGYLSLYEATFWKNTGALAHTKVTFKVNGVSYTKKTDKNGLAKLPVNLRHGTYVISSTNPYSKEKLSNKLVVKKDSTVLTHGSTKTYISPNKKYTFTVSLKTKHNAVISDQKITFTYNHKKVTTRTNEHGKASITIPGLSKGTYKIFYKFDGNKRFPGSSETGYLYVKSSTTKLSASNLKMDYKDGSKFKVKLTDNNKVLSNKNVKITLNKKTTTVKTNSKGIASLAVGNLKPGTYKVSYSYSSKSSSNYAHGSSKIIISKVTLKMSAKDLTVQHKNGISKYVVTVKDSKGKAVKDIRVKIKINGVNYVKKTNSSGQAYQDIGLNIGYYAVKSFVSSSCYKSNDVTKHILVDGTKFVAGDKHVSIGTSISYSVKLLNGKKKPIQNKKVTFKCNGKTYTDTTNSKGIAKVKLGVLSAGNHNIKYSDGSYSDSSKISVINKVALKQILDASKNVKSYIEKNHKLPSSVEIGDIKYSTAEYLYLASKAIVHLKSDDKSDISIKDVSNPKNPGSASNMGNLENYLAAAKKVVSAVESNGIAPNSVSSDVGNIGYKGLVYAFARVDAFYNSNGRLPSYVSIDSLSGSSSTSSNVNSKNTISNLAAYLAASTNCQVNNTKIKELVTKLTKGLSSDHAKAKAIFNYVRDTISYSFYYDTKYGAVGTLNSKTGNCVDHSHLLVAMYRTANLPARYAHGTCTFSSGSTYGHVWAQVLLGDTWTVSDATSSRNSLGSVANWNTHSYKLQSYSASISF